MPQSTTRKTPFRLTYGTNALIPVEIGEPYFWQQHYDEANHIENLMVKLDLVQETRALMLVISECKPKAKIVDICEKGDSYIRE